VGWTLKRVIAAGLLKSCHNLQKVPPLKQDMVGSVESVVTENSVSAGVRMVMQKQSGMRKLLMVILCGHTVT
jgi:hypothetical protein